MLSGNSHDNHAEEQDNLACSIIKEKLIAKCNRTVASLKAKLQATIRLHKGKIIKEVASDLGVREVSAGDWKMG